MAIPEPHPNKYNTAREVRRETDTKANFSIGLYDIDLTLSDYMNDVIAPTITDVDGSALRVPIIYGSPERWVSARKYGYVRDQKGQIQLPLVMFKRTTVSKSDQVSAFGALNRFQTRSFIARYTTKNKYDKFAVMNNVQPTRESYNVISPDHVTLTYDCMAWTSYTEHLNAIIEQFTFADEDYWGNKTKYKFRTNINTFSISNELTSNNERVVRASFNMTVQAYLLPESFANKMTTTKSFTPKRLIVMTEIETDNTNLRADLDYLTNTTEVSLLSSYQPVFDFLALNNQFNGTFVSATSGGDAIYNILNSEILPIPPEASTLMTSDDRYQVFVNGVFIESSIYSFVNSDRGGNNNNVVLTIDTALLGFDLDASDEITVKGKFVDIDNNSLATNLIGRPTPSVSIIKEYQHLFDFLALNDQFTGVFVSNTPGVTSTVQFIDTRLVSTPGDLPITFAESDKYQILINGIEATASSYTLTNSGNNIVATFQYDELGFDINSLDIVIIRGKITSV